MASTNEQPKPFDRLAFLVRLGVIAVLATTLLIERVRRQDRSGALLVVGVGYVVLPALAYLQTRYFNLVFNFGISEAVRRMVSRSKRHSSS